MLCARKSRLRGPVPFHSLPGIQRQCCLIKENTPTAELTCPAPGSRCTAPEQDFLVEDFDSLSSEGTAPLLLASDMGNPSVELRLRYQYLTP